MKATLADLRERRKQAQPAGIKTFGSTFKNPDDPRAEGRTAGQLLEAAGCRGLRVGDAGFSDKHANFVENLGGATTADVVALMAAGRERVRQQFGIELEPEVQALGPVELPERLAACMSDAAAGSATSWSVSGASSSRGCCRGGCARCTRSCSCWRCC